MWEPACAFMHPVKRTHTQTDKQQQPIAMCNDIKVRGAFTEVNKKMQHCWICAIPRHYD